MKLCLCCSFICSLICSLIAGPVWAQGGSAFLESAAANRLSPGLPDLTVRKLSSQAVSPECPKNIIAVDFYYPQGLGSATIDRLAETFAKNEFNKISKAVSGGDFCGRKICGGEACGLWPSETTFAVHTPSLRFLSILFTETSYAGGAHGNLEYEVLNFASSEGRAMSLTDLFPDPKLSAPQYCAFINEGFKQLGAAEDKAPENCLKAAALEDLGPLILTAQGAVFLLGPYEFGSYAEGSRALDLPKDLLLNMGANPAVWGE